MNTLIPKKIFYLLILCFLMGCSPRYTVVSDKDDSEDFSQFSTFEFMGWAEDSDKKITRFDKERIESSFAKEAQRRGMSRVESDGDVIASLYVVGQVKTQQTANTTTMGGGMGWGMRGPGWGWGTAHSTTIINENQYLEGTLVVELYDKADQKLIWQAIGSKTVSEDPKKRAKEIPKFIAAIMNEYPVKPSK